MGPGGDRHRGPNRPRDPTQGSVSSAPSGGASRSLPPVRRTSEETSGLCRRRCPSSQRSSFANGREIGQRVERPRGPSCGGGRAASTVPRQHMSRDGVGNQRRDLQIESSSGRASDGTSISSGGGVQSLEKGEDVGRDFHRSVAIARRWCPQPIRRHDDSDRCSRVHIEGSREKRSRSILHKCVREMEARYGMRGVRVGEASHPGPPGSLLRRLRTSRQGALTPMDTADRTDVDFEALVDELAGDLLPHDGFASPPTHSACSIWWSSGRRGCVWCQPALG